MPIINTKIFKEGDVTDKDDFKDVLKAVEGTSSATGLYGSPGDLVHGADQDNFREGGIDRRSLHFDGNENTTSDISIVNTRYHRSYNNGEIALQRNERHEWAYIEDENVKHTSPFIRTNYAGIAIPWNAETDQYCIIRCSAYIDTYGSTGNMISGSDMWDLGLFIIPPGESSDVALPTKTNILHAEGVVRPVVWPYQRVMLSDAYRRNFTFHEALTLGFNTDGDGNDFMSGAAQRFSRFNASFQLNFAARSGKSHTQAGVCPSAGADSGDFNRPPIWSSSGTAYAYLVYRNLIGDVPLISEGSVAYAQDVVLRNFRLNFTKYRR
jgi:hypothetical protein